MEHRGEIRNVEELLALLAALEPNTTVVLSKDTAEYRISIIDGLLRRVARAPQTDQDILGALLVRAQVLEASDLMSALEMQEQSKKSLGELLCENGFVSEEVVTGFLRKQFLVEVERLIFEFEPLEYEFVEAVEGFEETHLLPKIEFAKFVFTCGTVWKNSRIALDESHILRQRQDLDAFLAASKVLPRTTARSQKEVVRDWQVEIGACERALYALAKEKLSLAQACERLPYARHEVLRGLQVLLDANLLRLQEKRESNKPGLVEELWSEHRPYVLYRSLSFALVFSFLGLLGYLSFAKAGEMTLWFDTTVSDKVSWDAVKDDISAWQMNKIRFALEVYHAQEGDYPASLEALVVRGLLRFEDLSYPWRHDYAYIRSEEGYEVLKPIY